MTTIPSVCAGSLFPEKAPATVDVPVDKEKGQENSARNFTVKNHPDNVVAEHVRKQKLVGRLWGLECEPETILTQDAANLSGSILTPLLPELVAEFSVFVFRIRDQFLISAVHNPVHVFERDLAYYVW